MAFCSHCGAALEEGAKFCSSCGTALEAQTSDQAAAPVSVPVENQNNFDQASAEPKKASGTLNMTQMVWSIINLILCCMPLGIASLILTVFAKDAPSAEEEAKKLKIAKTCNLIGLIAFVVYLVVCFVIGVLIGISEYL